MHGIYIISFVPLKKILRFLWVAQPAVGQQFQLGSSGWFFWLLWAQGGISGPLWMGEGTAAIE